MSAVATPIMPKPKSNEDDAERGGSVTVLIDNGEGTGQFGASFGDKVIRARFIRKVYSILLSQLCVTTAVVALVIFCKPIKSFYCDTMWQDDYGMWRCSSVSTNGMVMYFVSYAIFFVTYFALVCCEKVRKRSPGNIIAMGIFTLALSTMAASIAVYHDVMWVLMAIGITALLCLGLTLFSFQTKWDITGKGMYLFAFSWVLFLFGIFACIFAGMHYPIMYTVYSGLTALLFSAFLVYDTQQLMGGKKYSISPEEHMYAAVQLYVDVVMIFLAILNLGRSS